MSEILARQEAAIRAAANVIVADRGFNFAIAALDKIKAELSSAQWGGGR